MKLMPLEHIAYEAAGNEPPCVPSVIWFDPTKVVEVRPWPSVTIKTAITVELGYRAVDVYRIAETAEEFMARREGYL